MAVNVMRSDQSIQTAQVWRGWAIQYGPVRHVRGVLRTTPDQQRENSCLRTDVHGTVDTLEGGGKL